MMLLGMNGMSTTEQRERICEMMFFILLGEELKECPLQNGLKYRSSTEIHVSISASRRMVVGARCVRRRNRNSQMGTDRSTVCQHDMQATETGLHTKKATPRHALPLTTKNPSKQNRAIQDTYTLAFCGAHSRFSSLSGDEKPASRVPGPARAFRPHQDFTRLLTSADSRLLCHHETPVGNPFSRTSDYWWLRFASIQITAT
ncbi:hypothetical protein DFH09DRAFT_196278 [Mycena vulgaris]|nr:hypothetical protein DFH09DRAFT_196278 [Mycena vulgaris]